jgi:hypothetical protein
MNRVLLEEIVKHIFSNFAVYPSLYVDFNKSKSLMRNEYLLSDKLTFESEGEDSQNSIWGCQLSADTQELKVLLGDCSLTKNLPEMAMVIQLKNLPFYGLYLVGQEQFDPATQIEPPEFIDPEPMIACSLNGKDWMECNTFLQATFLAAMEQVRDVGLTWSKCSNYKDQHSALLSFIRYHDLVYRDDDAR